MALPNELEALTEAFSGHGIHEQALVSILGKWHPEERKFFRKGSPHFFVEDERNFERWDDHHVRLLKHEFMRFKNAVVLWTMHPWERDARLAKEALIKKGPQSHGILIEIACTRSAEELLGARRAYHSLFDHSLEEDVAHHINGSERKLLVALVSAYRYEGSKVNDDAAKSEAKTLFTAIKDANKRKPIDDEEVIRVLTTRSKPHLQAIYKHYKEISGKNIDEDLDADLRLKETVQCICTPQKYFSRVIWKPHPDCKDMQNAKLLNFFIFVTFFLKVLNTALKRDVDKNTKKALTRVIVTRADTDMKEIKEEYNKLYGVSLSKKIEDTANGNYKDFLLTLIARGG